MHDGAKRYRSRIEVLRDFLVAARTAPKKTRIMGLANLNPRSFHKYSRLALELELVTNVSGSYSLTPKAERVLESLDQIVSRSEAVESALSNFRRECSLSPGAETPRGTTLRQASQAAWAEITRGIETAGEVRLKGVDLAVSSARPGLPFPGWLTEVPTVEIAPKLFDDPIPGPTPATSRGGRPEGSPPSLPALTEKPE